MVGMCMNTNKFVGYPASEEDVLSVEACGILADEADFSNRHLFF